MTKLYFEDNYKNLLASELEIWLIKNDAENIKIIKSLPGEIADIEMYVCFYSYYQLSEKSGMYMAEKETLEELFSYIKENFLNEKDLIF